MSDPAHPWGVNFGGGVNSTALLLLCHDRGLRPDWVLFADTGSELPETYVNVHRVEEWCQSVGFPFETVRWIRKDGSFESVHDNALRTHYLPSKAYGLAGCTYKWKLQPMERWRKVHGFGRSTVAIGYDAGETRRVAKLTACDNPDTASAAETFWYPLVEWGIDRAACVARITAQGWPSSKSSCFLCPNMRDPEWAALKEKHLDLYQIAQDVEAGARLAGNADTASLFRNHDPAQSCFCFADGRDDGALGLPAPKGEERG